MQVMSKLINILVAAALAASFAHGQTMTEAAIAGKVASSAPTARNASAAASAKALPEAASPQATSAPQNTGAAPSSAAQTPQQTPTGQVPTQSLPAQEGSAPMRVLVGKSILINTTDRLRRVSVTDPAVADAIAVTPNQVLVHGRAPGEVSLLLWDEQERSRSFDLRVDIDVTALAEEVNRIFPQQEIKVSASRNSVVLSGHVNTKEDADRVALLAQAYSKNVVNVLSFGPLGSEEILLEVKFAEVNRSALLQLGANIFSTGGGNTLGRTTTGQFPSSGGLTLRDLAPRVPGTQTSTEFNFTDLLNVFLFRPDIHLGATIRALQQKNVLQILAEPNLVAINGKEASFLAGGEFPIPVVQGGTTSGGNSITILFKEFGIRLKFTPTIMANGDIRLRVNPEVSALDYANGVTLSGFTVPGLTTRRADTELQMRDGQSFIIAGLLDNRVRDNLSKVPGIGNIPILGYLFKSKDTLKQQTELMVLVTARRISPADQPANLPGFPKEFLKQQQFDDKKTEGSKSGAMR